MRRKSVISLIFDGNSLLAPEQRMLWNISWWRIALSLCDVWASSLLTKFVWQLFDRYMMLTGNSCSLRQLFTQNYASRAKRQQLHPVMECVLVFHKALYLTTTCLTNQWSMPISDNMWEVKISHKKKKEQIVPKFLQIPRNIPFLNSERALWK